MVQEPATNYQFQISSERDIRAGVKTGKKEILSLELVWIAPGTFMMGSPGTEPGRRSNEGPQTKVAITHGFWMGKYEITVAQYRNLVGDVPSYIKQANVDDNAPVVSVSWENAVNFCRLLTQSDREGQQVSEGYLYRLPTEAEWEYACRAGTETPFSFGQDGNFLELYGWFEANSGGRPRPVGGRLPNPWGLYDMHGNAQEWCFDHFRPRGGIIADPVGPLTPEWCALRSGAWDHRTVDCRSAWRHVLASAPILEAGFRVVLARPISQSL